MNRLTRQLLNPHIERYFSTTANEAIKKLIDNKKVVVFMKGVPDAPKCGFSNAVTQILRMHGVQYDAHDVLKDESLRQGIYITQILYIYLIDYLMDF